MQGVGSAVDVPELGEKIKLVMLVRDDKLSFLVTDGTRSYGTSLTLWAPGRIGLWHDGNKKEQKYNNFNICEIPDTFKEDETEFVFNALPYNTGKLTSPQDWVLVMERVE